MTGAAQLELAVWILVAVLAVVTIVRRRRDRVERRAAALDPAHEHEHEPEVVDRAFDSDRCAYCEEDRVSTCGACGRPTCADHRPRANRFCSSCEAEWARGERARTVVIAPIVILTMVAVAAVGAVLTAFAEAGKLGLSVIVLAIAIAAPLYGALEGMFRRRFRPKGTVPTAALRRSPR